ncbi:MAG: VCBS repeat-containing protein [Planctomycetes bacterium]|nr:VCBS repeat-containing protein [Planctomycetota bacterium]
MHRSSAVVLLHLSACSLVAQAQFVAPLRPALPADLSPEFKIAVGDVDGDGFPDLVCANMGGTLPGAQNTLYRNDRLGGFVDATATHLPQVVDWTGAVALGDIDGDGDLDLFFGSGSGQPSRLYANDGTGRFTDVSAAQLPPITRTLYCAKMVDIDHDGDLDIVAREKVLLNDGLGNFTDVTGIHAPSAPISAWGMAVGDVNGDGHVDVMFGLNSNTVPPVLWLNNGAGVFAAASGNLPGPVYVGGDFQFGDFDRDGDLDVFLQAYARPSKLWLNDGSGVFTDVSATNLPALTAFSYASAVGDLDLDGDLDVVLFVGANVAGQTLILRNNGAAVFAVDAAAAPVATMASSCGALADLDLDGDLDLVFGNWNTQNAVWWNQHRHCHAAAAPTPGSPYSVTFASQPGYGPSTTVLIAVSIFPPGPLQRFPSHGSTVLQLGTVVTLGLGTTAVGSGEFGFVMAIPNGTGLSGMPLLWQGVVVEQQGAVLSLTNVFGDRVL